MNGKTLLTWIELSEKALTRNIASLSRLAGGRRIAVSVKSNAYGHGLAPMVGMFLNQPQVSYLTVHSLEEARLCRQYGWDRRIMVLGPIPLDSLEGVFELDLEPVVFTKEALRRLGVLSNKARTKVRTHLKLETGTHRQGIPEKALKSFASIYKRYRYLGKPYGAGMHFANIEDTTSHEYAQKQLNRFGQAVKQMTALGIKPTIRHTACSAALILFEKTRFELVRPGISVYGHWPSKETYLSYRLEGGRNDIFEPVLAWKTRVTQIKEVPADSFVGYGCTYRTTARSRLAVLPVGYADGYSRALSNLAYVLVNGRRAPVRGRVCMNLMMVDITDIPGVKLEDPVTLIGGEGSDRLSAEQMADLAGSINYEILARLSPTLERAVVPS
ncbi:MAG: alanine racemase [bacterium]|nr:alanine racemase [bacterium]